MDVLFAVVLPLGFVFVVYYFFFRPVSPEESVSLPGAETHARGARVREALRVLETIHFTDAGEMLNSAAFHSLTDFTLPPVPETYGRENPFTRPDVLERIVDSVAPKDSKTTTKRPGTPATSQSLSATLDAARQGLGR